MSHDPGLPPIDPRGTLRPPGSYPPPPGPGFPPGFMPPPMMGPMMPPPPQRSGGAGIALGIVAALLVLSAIANLALLIGLGLMSGPEPGQQINSLVRTGDRSQTVAVIRVDGIIMEDVEQQFADDLQTAADDPDVKAVVIEVDSPGGTVTDSHQMYARLQQFKDHTGKPVVVHMNSVAASGGYFLACAADEIFAEETTITGSIGVLLSYPELSGFAEKTGIRFETIVSDGSPFKDLLDTWSKPEEAELASVKQLLNDQYDLFRTVVLDGRSDALSAAGTDVADVANGKVFLGPQAKANGLVDQIGFRDDAVASAATRAGLTNYRVIEYTREPTLGEVLGLAETSVDPKAEAPVLQGESLKEAALGVLHELSTPRSLYLYRGVQ